MIALAPFVERLKEAGYGHVKGLFEFAQLTAPPRNLPAAFVIPESEGAAGQPKVGAYDQLITLRLSVVIVMEAPGRNAAQASETLTTELRRVKDSLFGWKHPEAASACMIAGGRLLDLDASTLSWAAQFTCTYRERKTR
ncbi:hypothetical protein MKP08_08285 [Erythrobacter sp. LQ02-29]|uniref:phage tail terminator protein n=1 Tax=Erythrobacter sp. LQ02-29 TaxID=2920384 RepID=UPI001F4DE780|nr:hypothetical protein [Erythrobacter sp. LQ02-29]MCP9222741.1 hypothetical protein [Erythrobacter sp. LQ02-29]